MVFWNYWVSGFYWFPGFYWVGRNNIHYFFWLYHPTLGIWVNWQRTINASDLDLLAPPQVKRRMEQHKRAAQNFWRNISISEVIQIHFCNLPKNLDVSFHRFLLNCLRKILWEDLGLRVLDVKTKDLLKDFWSCSIHLHFVNWIVFLKPFKRLLEPGGHYWKRAWMEKRSVCKESSEQMKMWTDDEWSVGVWNSSPRAALQTSRSQGTEGAPKLMANPNNNKNCVKLPSSVKS